MEDFKVAIALEERPDNPIKYRTLGAVESQSVFSEIARLGSVSWQPEKLFFVALANSLTIERIYKDEITEDFLRPLFYQKHALPDSTCYILWNIDEPIDQFEVKSLLVDWDYLWYSASDEALVIYLPYSERLILVTDHGMVKTNF